MSLIKDILQRIILTPEQRELISRKNQSMAMEDYEFLTGKKLSSKQRKTANEEMDKFMAEKGYRPMYRKVNKFKSKRRKLKVGQSEAIGKTSRLK